MNQTFLAELLSTGSVSGNELALEKKIYDYMLPLAQQVTVDELGNVVASLNAECPFKILLTGHADEIGLMVSAITGDGFLKVINIGGIYPSTYLGHKVRIQTQRGILYGAVCNTRSLSKKEELKCGDILIDIGAADKEDALQYVSVGDTIYFDTDMRPLLNNRITARAMDDRIGAFIVMEALLKAKKMGASVGCYAAATTGEETTTNGAYFTASRIKPALAIAVDVTYTSDYPGTDIGSTGDVAIGKGPVLCHNPSIHRGLNQLLAASAQRAGIAVQWEVANGRTGTDGDVIHKTGIGVPFALVSIPLRYMHCPGEVGSLDDIQHCIDLLAQFLCDCTTQTSLKPF